MSLRHTTIAVEPMVKAIQTSKQDVRSTSAVVPGRCRERVKSNKVINTINEELINSTQCTRRPFKYYVSEAGGGNKVLNVRTWIRARYFSVE